LALSPSDVDALLDAFMNFPVVDSYAQSLAEVEPPALIYHYTDEAGLKGILQSGTLWITNIFSLNDPSEMRHGVSHACELLNSAASTVNASHALRSFSQTVTKGLTNRIEEAAQLFICCFSEHGDDLGQWRLYADDGRGYALGFEARALEQSFVKAAPDYRATFPICYDESQLRKMQSQIVDETLKILAAAESVLTAEHMRSLSAWFSIHVIRAALFFKHRAYMNEKEYRFLQLYGVGKTVPDLQTRGKKLSCLFHWRSNAPAALRKIVAGPAISPAGLTYLEDCIRRHHSGRIGIERSDIPYRSFRP
jgi:hypothetical protein